MTTETKTGPWIRGVWNFQVFYLFFMMNTELEITVILHLIRIAKYLYFSL